MIIINHIMSPTGYYIDTAPITESNSPRHPLSYPCKYNVVSKPIVPELGTSSDNKLDNNYFKNNACPDPISISSKTLSHKITQTAPATHIVPPHHFANNSFYTYSGKQSSDYSFFREEGPVNEVRSKNSEFQYVNSNELETGPTSKITNVESLNYNETERASPSYDGDNWWSGINLDSLELDARAKLNNKQTEEIKVLRKRLNKTRKYTKRLLKRLRLAEQLNFDNAITKDAVEYAESPSFKNIFHKTEEFLFRNKCMIIIYGSVPSIALWKYEDTVHFNIDFWKIWSDSESKKIIKSLYLEYRDCDDLLNLLNISPDKLIPDDTESVHKKTLLNLIEWMFNSN